MVFITQQQHNTHSSKQDIFQLARDLGRYLNAMRRVNLSINRESLRRACNYYLGRARGEDAPN